MLSDAFPPLRHPFPSVLQYHATALPTSNVRATMLTRMHPFRYGFNLIAERKKKDATEIQKLKLELFSPAFSVAALIATTAYITVEAVSDCVLLRLPAGCAVGSIHAGRVLSPGLCFSASSLRSCLLL